jgi:hypothetical protein
MTSAGHRAEFDRERARPDPPDEGNSLEMLQSIKSAEQLPLDVGKSGTVGAFEFIDGCE